MPEQIIKLNDNFIARPEDRVFFDHVHFKIYKFNPKGFKLLNFVPEKGIELITWKGLCLPEVTEDEFSHFYNKCLNYGILTAT